MSDFWVQRWEVPKSGSDGFYTVGRDRNGGWGCSCPQGKFHRGSGPCKHVLHIQLKLERENRTAELAAAQEQARRAEAAARMLEEQLRQPAPKPVQSETVRPERKGRLYRI